LRCKDDGKNTAHRRKRKKGVAKARFALRKKRQGGGCLRRRSRSAQKKKKTVAGGGGGRTLVSFERKREVKGQEEKQNYTVQAGGTNIYRPWKKEKGEKTIRLMKKTQVPPGIK